MTVTLRSKPISGARRSLYLDYYPPIPHHETGKPTRREFLGLYILAPHSFNREANKHTQILAETIRAKRWTELLHGEYKRKVIDADFVQYFKDLASKRGGNWEAAIIYLEKFTGATLKFSDLTEKKCNEFRQYLLNTISKRSNQCQLAHNSAVTYFAKFKASLKQAFKDGYLQRDLNAKVEAIPPEETHREFLTLKELQALVRTECKLPILKQASLFSIVTGLRFSDIQKLVWSEVHTDHEGGAEIYYLQFWQKKTKGAEILPISQQAYNLLGIRGEPDSKVFTGLKYSAYINRLLKTWILKAGIKKEITFHCFRHTFATLQLTLGTDIYTISKMLGHRDLRTTQIYAKIVDIKKREAAEKIKLDF